MEPISENGNQHLLHKGVAKVNKGLKIHTTKVHDITKQRCVELLDNKNTKIYVKLTDARTDNEIREHFLSR